MQPASPKSAPPQPIGRGFWTDAWDRTLRRPSTKLALAWITAIAIFAVIAPLIASGHPLILRHLDGSGAVLRTEFPLIRYLDPADWLALGSAAVISLLCIAPLRAMRRLQGLLISVIAIPCVIAIGLSWNRAPDIFDYHERTARGAAEAFYTIVPWSPTERPGDRDASNLPPGSTGDAALVDVVLSGMTEGVPLTQDQLELVRDRITKLPLREERRHALRAEVEALAALSPVPPAPLRSALSARLAGSGRIHMLGTDADGQDVLSQMLHACRLACSIGIVSTGIALIIGVTIGAVAGYCGGSIDLVLSRIIEVFMGVPLLFILIVASGLFPRNLHITMAIIGCFTWMGAARFTRAEFLRLRDQDFVLAARAAGAPLRSILFRHMLPSAITPILIDSSFAISAAIVLEATLSYLGLGPVDAASWGRLLADAAGESGDFHWWLAFFPGLAIFLTALSYNMLGEALRDAADPRTSRSIRDNPA